MIGFAILILVLGVIVISFSLLFTIDFFTELNYKFHNYTPPKVPMYFTHCPPPPPIYYVRREILNKAKSQNSVVNPNKLSDFHSK